MRTCLLFISFFYAAAGCFAQHSLSDSILEIMRQDSIEFARQKNEASRIANETDSFLRRELGSNSIKITKTDSALLVQRLRTLALQQIAEQEAAEKKHFYIMAAAVIGMTAFVIIAFKKKTAGK